MSVLSVNEESEVEMILDNSTSFTSTLRSCVHQVIEKYFIELEGQPVTNVYDMVLSEVEEPLMAFIMVHTEGNQSKAAEILGLNRGTLRKKLKQYQLI